MTAFDTSYLTKRLALKAWNFSIRLTGLRARCLGQDHYAQRVYAMHKKLRIPDNYRHRGFCIHHEASDLVAVYCGPNGKTRLMSRRILPQWLDMRTEAAKAGITLVVKSAFRSAEEQALIIREQLIAGATIDQLLTSIAAPGYSEHHTGRALDLDCHPSGTEFSDTPAFQWLLSNASKFGFRLSYPRDNPYGISYEPWHWYCSRSENDSPQHNTKPTEIP